MLEAPRRAALEARRAEAALTRHAFFAEQFEIVDVDGEEVAAAGDGANAPRPAAADWRASHGAGPDPVSRSRPWPSPGRLPRRGARGRQDGTACAGLPAA